MYPSNYETLLKDELWGCFKYIGLPMETVMNMPIQDRKYYVRKHNEYEAGMHKDDGSSVNVRTYEGEALNYYAELDQNKSKGGL